MTATLDLRRPCSSRVTGSRRMQVRQTRVSRGWVRRGGYGRVLGPVPGSRRHDPGAVYPRRTPGWASPVEQVRWVGEQPVAVRRLWGFRSPPELVTCGDRQPGMIADVSLLHGGAASASSLAAEDQVRPERLGLLQHRLSRAWARPGRHRIRSRHPRPPRDPRRHGHDLPVLSGAASGDRAWICRAGGLAVVDGTGPDGGQATRRLGRSGDRPARPGRGPVNRQRPITYPPRALSRACRFQPTNGAGNLTVKLRPYRSALVDTRHRRASYCRPGHRVRSAPCAGSPQQSALSGDPPGHRQG